MHQLAVLIGDTTWAFIWHKKEDAIAARDVIHSAMEFIGVSVIRVIDDYGQEMDVENNAIRAVLYEDLERTGELRAARALMQAREQIRTSDLAQRDPMIKVRMNMQGRGDGLMIPGR